MTKNYINSASNGVGQIDTRVSRQIRQSRGNNNRKRNVDVSDLFIFRTHKHWKRSFTMTTARAT